MIPNKPVEEKIEACDRSAWTFTAFDETGKEVFCREPGYIYHIEPLEEIAGILTSYVPDYDVPKYGSSLSPVKSGGGEPFLDYARIS